MTLRRSDPTGAVPDSPKPRRQPGWDGPRTTVLIAAVISAALSLTLKATIFSHLSVNNDETAYLLQAKALAHWHLFPPAGHPAGSFTPWLGVTRGGHYVLKYTPVVAMVMAVSLVVTGSYLGALVAIAVGLVTGTYLLARELTGNRSTAATAAVLMAASPLVILQTALVLPYVLAVVLAEFALWALLVGSRRGQLLLLWFGGFCAGLDLVIRSYDALLFLGPTAVWVLRRSAGRRRRVFAGAAAGAALPVLGLLWFDSAATGSPFRLPFSLFNSADSLGFGVRRIYPGEAPRHFGISQAVHGIARHLSLLGGGWAFGGILLAVLAGYALVRHRYSAELLAVLVGGVLLVIGYLFFWGTWNAAIIWGGTRYLGPYYLLPFLLPLCVLAAAGLRELVALSRPRAVMVSALAAAVSTAAFVPAIAANAGLNAANVELARTVAAQGRALVFVITYPSYLQHPTAVISNLSPIGGRTVYALERGAPDFDVLRAYPGRPVYRLKLIGEYGKRPHTGYGAALDSEQLVSGRSVDLVVGSRLSPSYPTALLELSVGNQRRTWQLTGTGATTTALTLAGLTLAGIDGLRPGAAATASLVLTGRSAGGGEHVLDRMQLAVRLTADGRVECLVPNRRVAELGPLAPPALSILAAHGTV